MVRHNLNRKVNQGSKKTGTSNSLLYGDESAKCAHLRGPLVYSLRGTVWSNYFIGDYTRLRDIKGLFQGYPASTVFHRK